MCADDLGDRHLRRMTEKSLDGSWFEVEGAQDVALGKTGTRVGMPLADYCFNLSFRPIQDEITTTLRANDLLLPLDAPNAQPREHVLTNDGDSVADVAGPSYVGDLCSPSSGILLSGMMFSILSPSLSIKHFRNLLTHVYTCQVKHVRGCYIGIYA